MCHVRFGKCIYNIYIYLFIYLFLRICVYIKINKIIYKVFGYLHVCVYIYMDKNDICVFVFLFINGGVSKRGCPIIYIYTYSHTYISVCVFSKFERLV
jgi:hypothetical protein